MDAIDSKQHPLQLVVSGWAMVINNIVRRISVLRPFHGKVAHLVFQDKGALLRHVLQPDPLFADGLDHRVRRLDGVRVVEGRSEH